MATADAIERDEAQLAEAWRLPVASIYNRSERITQRLRALCGPTSAVVLLRSLGIPAAQATILEGTGVTTLFGLRGGVTLDQLCAVVRRWCAQPVTALRDLDLATFRAELQRVNDPSRRYIVNFDRHRLFGWGGGHHSPLVGYLPATDRALVLDVNPRVGPWLVSAARLHAAVATIDPSTGQERGLLRVE